jgi:hypothetical protein
VKMLPNLRGTRQTFLWLRVAEEEG